MVSDEEIKANPKPVKVYGYIDLFMGPGDEHGFLHIPIVYDANQKLQYVQWDGGSSTISKSLFDRDLAPKCHESLAKVKEVMGRLAYGTMYLVKETGVTKVTP